MKTAHIKLVSELYKISSDQSQDTAKNNKPKP